MGEDTRYIRFEIQPPVPGRKTLVWHVMNVGGGYLLGTIKWHGPWRQYVFLPVLLGDPLFNSECLHAIADFCKAHREDRSVSKSTEGSQ